MKIYLIRHSNAVDPGTHAYEDDSLRPLTEKGRDKMKDIAYALKAMDVKPDLIVSSPYVPHLMAIEWQSRLSTE